MALAALRNTSLKPHVMLPRASAACSVTSAAAGSVR